MTIFRHILVATDFSPPATRSLNLGIEMATKLDAKLTLVHVFSLPQIDYGVVAYYPGPELEAAAQKALEETTAEAKKRFPSLDSVLVTGEASSRILDEAASRGSDLIIIGTHGRNWISRFVLGSVADKVVRTSPIPVLTVPGTPKTA